MFKFMVNIYTFLYILFITLSISHYSYAVEVEPRDDAKSPQIKVAIGLDLMEAKITLPSGGTVFNNVENKEEYNTNKKAELSFRFESNGKFSSSNLKGLFSDILIFPNSKSFCKFKGNSYRGYLRLVSSPTGIRVINHLDLEEYLYGVIPYEIPMSWPLEAIKAQTVAARTYAVRTLGQYPHGDFDVYDSVKDQVYGGVNGEKEKAIRAVEETRGIILTYQGWPILAYYHADAGGQTEEGKYIFPKDDYPYLASVPSKDDLERHQWSFTMKKSELESILKNSRRDVGSISSIEISQISPTGRPISLLITGSKGRLEISSTDFRKLIGAGRIRSTLFAILTKNSLTNPINFNHNAKILPLNKIEYSIKILTGTEIFDSQSPNLSIVTDSGIFDSDLSNIFIISASKINTFKPQNNTKLEEDEILFFGNGFGHGVGLSQWGAKAYAEEGWDYRKILSHYYPEAELTVWY